MARITKASMAIRVEYLKTRIRYLLSLTEKEIFEEYKIGFPAITKLPSKEECLRTLMFLEIDSKFEDYLN